MLLGAAGNKASTAGPKICSNKQLRGDMFRIIPQHDGAFADECSIMMLQVGMCWSYTWLLISKAHA